MKLSQLIIDSRECQIDFPGGNTLNVAYAPTKISALSMSQFGKKEVVNSTEQGTLLVRTSLEIIQSWDLEEDEPKDDDERAAIVAVSGQEWHEGMTVPLTQRRVSLLPTDLLATVLAAVYQDVNTGNPTNAPKPLRTSGAPSLKKGK